MTDDLRARLAIRLERDDHPLTLAGRSRHDLGRLRLDSLLFRTAQGQAVRGILCQPPGTGPYPAVLVIHAHGHRYDIGCDELMQGRPALAGPLGPALAAQGIASLALDLPCFGIRNATSESAAAKAALWAGRSLAGQMVGESAAALGWLAAEPGVRADRIGVFGISMGATLGTWLAAVDRRVHALVQLCSFADLGALIATGAHDLHGIYLTVPGLPHLAPNGQIAGLVAPRAQFIGLGDQDPLTPPRAADLALAQVGAAYDRAGGHLVIHREPASGHVETPGMRAALLRFLSRTLG